MDLVALLADGYREHEKDPTALTAFAPRIDEREATELRRHGGLLLGRGVDRVLGAAGAVEGHPAARIIADVGLDALDAFERQVTRHELRWSEPAELRAFYNIINLRLHALALRGALHVDPRLDELCFAVAALHPTQDDYVDAAELDDRALVTLRRRLCGERVSCPVPGLASTFALVDRVYTHLPPSRHPGLVEIFVQLQDWQVASIEQRLGRPDRDRLLEITLQKGGWAFALYGYVLQGGMTPGQLAHFFSMGGLFQLMDDLHDLDDDLRDGIETVWTRALREEGCLDSALWGTLGAHLRSESEVATSGFRYPLTVRAIERLSARWGTLRFTAMHYDRFSPAGQAALQEVAPFSMESASRFFGGTVSWESLSSVRRVLQALR